MIEFQPGDRKRLTVTADASTALANATVQLLVDGNPVACDWVADQTQASGRYRRLAQTTPFFAGPEADAQPGDVTLASGATRVQLQVKVGGVSITRPREYIVVARTAVQETSL